MKTASRHLALLTGVSLAALGFAAPAQAATSTAPGISHIDMTDPVEDRLVVCNIDDECFFGVDADGAGSVGAIVNDPSNGQIEQIGISLAGDVDLLIENYGDAEIGAHASASASAGIVAPPAEVAPAPPPPPPPATEPGERG